MASLSLEKELEKESSQNLIQTPLPLRPHHLLCTQGYSGKGYSSNFVENMNKVVFYLRNTPDSKIRLVFSTDALCAACPNQLGTDLCTSQEKVKRYDQKVIHYFGLKEGVYSYHSLIQEIDAHMTEAMLEDICDGCSWYPISACREKILNGKRNP